MVRQELPTEKAYSRYRMALKGTVACDSLRIRQAGQRWK